ncbi:MAG: hypothetical protein PVH46_00475 [Granulosicoccaceae bacterium]|jgi:hypothetical protein
MHLPHLQAGGQLPHGQGMKLKAVGLDGICTLLELEDKDTRDVWLCLDTLVAQYGQIYAIPAEPIVRSIEAGAAGPNSPYHPVFHRISV